MFGLFKKIFKKDESANSVIAPASPAAPAYSRTATPGQPGRPQANPFSDAATAAPASTATPAPPSVTAAAPAKRSHLNAAKAQARASAPVERIPNAVTLPLDEIVPGLTHEFQSLFESADDTEVSFPLQIILPQLSTGRIRVSFGDLRNACPNGSCKAGPEHDAKLVDLPLAKVLSRVNPAFLPRKTQRPVMDVPEDVTGLFGATGDPLPSVARTKKESVVQSVPPAASAPPVPVSSPSPVSAARTAALPVSNSTPNRKQAVTSEDLGDIPSPFNFQQSTGAEEPPLAQTPATVQPSAAKPEAAHDLEGQQPIKFSLSGPAAPPVTPEPDLPKAPVKPPVAKAAPRKPGIPTPVPVQLPKPTMAAPVPAPSPKPLAAMASKYDDDNFICLPVSKVQEEWPKPVQDEIAQYSLESAEFVLPYGEVDLAMRKGKIVFPWKTLRGWISPGNGVPASTSSDQEELVLPLKMVAPLFLKQRPASSKKRKISAEEEEIPDLFSGGPAEDFAAPAAPESAPTQSNQKARVSAPKPAPAPQAAKSMPKISASNPAELVTRTADMPGVTGALLAMSDGLMVASELPPALVGETVAAFLPQIFGRLTQFSAELKLGDLTSVMLVMDNSPWIIFRTGKVYFAVVGKPGEALPLPQLTAIVADIKRQNL